MQPQTALTEDRTMTPKERAAQTAKRIRVEAQYCSDTDKFIEEAIIAAVEEERKKHITILDEAIGLLSAEKAKLGSAPIEWQMAQVIGMDIRTIEHMKAVFQKHYS